MKLQRVHLRVNNHCNAYISYISAGGSGRPGCGDTSEHLSSAEICKFDGMCVRGVQESLYVREFLQSFSTGVHPWAKIPPRID